MLSGEDKRVLPRLTCSIAVGAAGKSAPLGELVDINLDGGRIMTTKPLPVGSHLPLVLQLEPGQTPLLAESEVVRATDGAMGVKFIKLSRPDSRRLRRFVVDLTTIFGHRDAASRLHNTASENSVPIRDAKLIDDLLTGSIASRVAHVIIPADKQVRYEAPLGAVTNGVLLYPTSKHETLHAGDFVFVLYTIDFVSYSFQTQVEQADAREIRLRKPEILHYSERRSTKRQMAAENSRLEMNVPWRQDTMSWPLIEGSETGFSFWSSEESHHFLPGTPLKGAVVVTEGEAKDLELAVVKHVSADKSPEGARRFRVGVEFGRERGKVALQSLNPEDSNRTDEKSPGKVSSWAENLSRKVSFVYHKKIKKSGLSAAGETLNVSFDNARGQRVVALLNTTFAPNQRTRAPVVLVVPGYGGRKETFSALAHTITYNFKRQYRDIAILRMDSTNNLGESDKSPGCEKEGASNLKYTVSGCIADIAGAVKWVHTNRHVDATDIVIISSSFSSIAVRRFLATPEGQDISHWFVMMGASDAQNCILHVAGNLDIYGNYMRGIKNGIISLIGCLVDADHFCEDLHKHNLATIEDARKDMISIKAHITWVIGKQDGYMDPRRIHDVMSVRAPGRREIIEVDSGHLPRSSQEALGHFAMLTGRLWRHLYQADLRCETPSIGLLDTASEAEWKRVRRENMKNSREYWRSYLLGQDDIGFDVLALSPYYRQLIVDQVALADPEQKRILDLGAGTGNVSDGLSRRNLRSLVAIDLVDLALERLKQKVGGRVPLEVRTASADGSALVAMRRWLDGELAGLSDLCGRVPGLQQNLVDQISAHYTPGIHAKLRGAEMDIRHIKGAMRIDPRGRDMISDLCLLSRYVKNRIAVEEARSQVKSVPVYVFDAHGGLPLQDSDFDTIVCSLVLSYLEHPDDALSEMLRVLKPNGTLIISSMKRDADSSMLYQDLIAYLEKAPSADLPEGSDRGKLIHAAREFSNHAADLLRFEEEGIFTFWSGDELKLLVQEAGFVNAECSYSFGMPGQAVIVKARKP